MAAIGELAAFMWKVAGAPPNSTGAPGRADDRWNTYFPQLTVERVPGDHYTMLRSPAVDVLAERVGHYLQQGVNCDPRG